MFDIWLRRRIDPALDRIACGLVKASISANQITIAGALLGVGAAVMIANADYIPALLLVGANRLLDGLDGAVARMSAPTAWGGYLDSIADYVFYIAVPIGFAFADQANVWPSLLLVSSFVLTAVSFLALAAILAGQDLGHGAKAFTYSTGLIEGGETIAAFSLMCLFPAKVPYITMALAALCLMTVVQRLWFAQWHLR